VSAVKKLWVLLLAALPLAGCGKGFRASGKAPVILISIDTLRADHLPAYGYEKVATPGIDAFRKDSILYGNAVSHVPLTLPSHATLMTGLLPPQGGVRDNTGYVLSDKHATLALELKKDGYATGAAVSTVVLVKSSGISRGFDFFDDDIEAKKAGMSISMIQRAGLETEKVSEEWIRAHEGSPFFYFLHLYEPHTPYEPVEPYRSRYPDNPYDGEIATADAIVGRFLDFLKGEKIYDGAMVILLSDHGEGLGDHGEDEHGTLLYRATLHVPLMVKLPGGRLGGSRVTRTVGLVDVFPTVAAVVGIPVPEGLSGVSLLEDGGKGAGRRIYSETLFPRYHFGWSDLACLTDGQYEYIHAPREELYDYLSDPGEAKNLAAGLPPAFRSMRNELLGMNRPRQAPGASDPEQVKKLAALGYLGSSAAPESAENLPDPKDHIQELHQMKIALKLYSEHKYEEFLVELHKLLKQNPRMSDGWGFLANALHKLGRNEEAIAALKEEDRISPGSPTTLSSFATEYFEMGDLKQARLYAQRSIAVNGPAEAHEVLAGVYLREKNYDAAEREALKAKGGYRKKKKPLIVLAQVAKGRGDLSGALAQLDAVKAMVDEQGEGDMSNVNYLRGDILARLGRNAEAEAAFRAEIKDFPNNVQAWTGLSLLYASQGRSDDARRTLLELVRTSPNPRSYGAAAEAFTVLGDPGQARRLRDLARQGPHREGGGSPES
jgi:tetratricopeptide (TPR) repeat protein